MARAKKEAALTPEERLQAALVPDWEWPYKLPENWCWTTVGAINQYAGISANPTKAKNETFELYSVPSSADNYPEIVLGADIGSTKQSVKKGDVLLCKINPRINRVWKVSKYTDHSLLASSEWIVIRNSGLISNYLMWCFRSPYFRRYMLSNVSGVGGSLMRAQPKFVQGYPVPVPPFAEQQRIVDRIESLFAKLDEAKEKAQAVVDSFETRKAAILYKAFTGELTAKWREEHNISKTTWGEKKWGDFLQSIEAGKNWSAEGRPPEGTEFGVVKVSAVTWGEFDELESKTCVVAEQWNSKTQIHKGDFLFSRANTLQLVGNCVIVRNISKRLMLSDKILRFKFDEIAHPRFVLYFTRSRIYREQVEQLASGNQDGMRNISQKNLKLVSFPIPTVVEQIEIISILDRAFAKEQQSKEAAEAVLDQIDLMKKSILARAFRGELGTNDPNEERAVELLKKVLHTSAEPKSKTKRKFIPPKIEAQIKTDLERKIIMAFIQSDTAIMPIQQLMSVSSRKFDVIETLRNLQERGILLKENDTYRLMG